MKIAIDLRSLASGSVSGVENYIINLLEHMLPLDRQNSYTLFYNAWARTGAAGEFNFVNSRLARTRLPNKILNAALKLKLVTMEKLAGEFDVLFMPNLNQFSLSPKAKLAVTVHDLSPVVTPEFYDFKRRLWHKFLSYQNAFARASVIFAVSEYTKQDLIKIFNVDPQKVLVVYPGLDHKVFGPDIDIGRLRRVRNLYGLPGKYILFLNTIEPRKNLTGLIRAFERLDSDAYLVIAGRRGWKHKRIFRDIQNSRKSARIKYIGYVDEADKPAVIKLADLLVYPSFYEGFGFQPLEAMAVGTPAVVSQVTSLPEVVADAALLADPYSTESLGRAMGVLLSDPVARQSFIDRGLKKASQYNWQHTAAGVLAGLNSIKL